MADTPTVPLALTVTGAYLAWFGVHYWRSDVAWPSDPVKAVLTGRPIPAAAVGLIEGPPLSQILPPAGAPPATGVYDASALRALWTSSGGDPGAAGTAAAVALAESSGRADAVSINPDGGTNVGLWQLDTRGKGAGYSVEQLKDPGTNAHVTILGSLNGANWSAWQTYVQGTYRKFL